MKSKHLIIAAFITLAAPLFASAAAPSTNPLEMGPAATTTATSTKPAKAAPDKVALLLTQLSSSADRVQDQIDELNNDNTDVSGAQTLVDRAKISLRSIKVSLSLQDVSATATDKEIKKITDDRRKNAVVDLKTAYQTILSAIASLKKTIEAERARLELLPDSSVSSQGAAVITSTGTSTDATASTTPDKPAKAADKSKASE